MSTQNEISYKTNQTIQQLQVEFQTNRDNYQENFKKLKIYHYAQQILLHNYRRNAYDKFQAFDMEQWSQINNNKFLFSKMIQQSFVYFIISIQILLSSMQRKYSQSAKWVILIVISFLIIDIDLSISNTSEPDLLDKLFPQMTIFERSEILKVVLMPLLMIIQQYFTYFASTDEEKILQILSSIQIFNQTILLRLKQQQAKQKEKANHLNESNQFSQNPANQEQSNQYSQQQQQQQQQQQNQLNQQQDQQLQQEYQQQQFQPEASQQFFEDIQDTEGKIKRIESYIESLSCSILRIIKLYGDCIKDKNEMKQIENFQKSLQTTIKNQQQNSNLPNQQQQQQIQENQSQVQEEPQFNQQPQQQQNQPQNKENSKVSILQQLAFPLFLVLIFWDDIKKLLVG